MASNTLSMLLSNKPHLLDPKCCCFPEDIVIKINNIICDEYIKVIYSALENNFIKNSIAIFMDDKKLSKFLYYFGYQQYNYIYIFEGVYGETINNLYWENFETDILLENFNGITADIKEPLVLNLDRDEIFSRENNYSNNTEIYNYKFDVNIYSSKLTLNETMWIIKHFARYDETMLEDNHNIDIDIHNNAYNNIYDYDEEEYATIWNLYNRGFIQLNIFKIISMYCHNNDIDSNAQKYYEFIGGVGNCKIKVDNTKLFQKTCYNIIKYFNKKIKKAADEKYVLSYLYAIYTADEGYTHFNEEHAEHENKAYDLLSEYGLLSDKTYDIYVLLDFLYERYLQ
jgi:hypothetical protein